MIFMVLQIVSDTNKENSASAQVWVNSHDPDKALTLATKTLLANGWRVTTLLESTTTTKEDYFPPCKSLDAFMRADKEGVAIRYS